MLFVLAGPSYVGKKTAIAHFVKLYAFSSIIPYTTKKKESSEIEGIQYHYTNEKHIRNKELFFFDQPFQFDENDDSEDIYAYKKKDIDDAIKSYGNYIIHSSVGNAKQIAEEYHNNSCSGDDLFILFLKYKSDLTEDFFRQKFPFEFNDQNMDRFIRRYKHAQKEQAFFEEHKEVFHKDFKEDNAYDMCDSLEEYILPKLKVMPTSPDKIPGPLSAEDIVYLAFNRKNDPLVVKNRNEKLSEDELKGILTGCGMHITLSSDIRIVKNSPFNNYINMAWDSYNMKDTLSKMYPTRSIATGYILGPDEVIMCSSNEKIYIPLDVYALVSSRFSYTQLGLSIELSTSIVQAGHDDRIHFQIKNNTKNYICIYPNISVAQLLFFRTVHPCSVEYKNNNARLYDDDNTPPISRFRENNNALDEVNKPKGTIASKHIEKVLKIGIERIIGVVLFLILCFLGYNIVPESISEKLHKGFSAFFESKITIMHCILIAMIAELIRICIIICGRFAKSIYHIIVRITLIVFRKNDSAEK